MNRLLCALKGLSKTDISAICALAASFIFLVVFALINGTFPDEAFYISIPVRLINGDGLFTDEWHLSQLSAVLLYLPVRLFTAITGGTEGIILFMRLLFCSLQLGTGILLYSTLRKYGAAAVIISASFMCFFAVGINTLSYNTLGIATLFALICVIYRCLERPSYIKMLLSGSLIAAFILCQPLGVIFYLIYFGAVCVFALKNGKCPEKTLFPFTLKSFFMTVAGILPVLVFFLILLLSNSDPETIISCIPGILNDIEHMEIEGDLGVETFSLFTFFKDMTMSVGTVSLIIFAVCLTAAPFIKKINKNAAIILTAAAFAAVSVIFWVRIAFMNGTTETDDIYFFFLPLALPGIVFYILPEKKNKPVLLLFWCTGILYALFMTVTSNMGLHASVNGYLVSAAGTLLLAGEALSELRIHA